MLRQTVRGHQYYIKPLQKERWRTTHTAEPSTSKQHKRMERYTWVHCLASSLVLASGLGLGALVQLQSQGQCGGGAEPSRKAVGWNWQPREDRLITKARSQRCRCEDVPCNVYALPCVVEW